MADEKTTQIPPFEQVQPQQLTDEQIEQARKDRVQARIEEGRQLLKDVCDRLKLNPIMVETKVNGATTMVQFDFVERQEK